MADISKARINGTTYYIKDEDARKRIEQQELGPNFVAFEVDWNTGELVAHYALEDSRIVFSINEGYLEVTV